MRATANTRPNEEPREGADDIGNGSAEMWRLGYREELECSNPTPNCGMEGQDDRVTSNDAGRLTPRSRGEAVEQLARNGDSYRTAIEGDVWTITCNPNSQMGKACQQWRGADICRHRSAGEAGRASKSNKDGVVRSMRKTISESQESEDGRPSRLSPLFTEEMMGFPLMWTALPFLSESGAPKPSKPTATPSSPK